MNIDNAANFELELNLPPIIDMEDEAITALLGKYFNPYTKEEALNELIKIYGTVFIIPMGGGLLVNNDPDLIFEEMMSDDFDKGPGTAIFNDLLGKGLVTAPTREPGQKGGEKSLYKKIKEVLLPRFHPKTVQEQLPLIEEVMIRIIGANLNQEIDTSLLTQQISLGVVEEIIFPGIQLPEGFEENVTQIAFLKNLTLGEPLDIEEFIKKGIQLPEGFDAREVLDLKFNITHSNELQELYTASLKEFYRNLYIAKLKELHRGIDIIVDRFIESPNETSTLNHILQLVQAEIIPDAYGAIITLFIAGVETTKTTMDGIFEAFRKNPEMFNDLKKLKNEDLDEFDKQARSLINDVLRVFTPVPHIYKDVRKEKPFIKLGDYVLPAGMRTAINIRSVHMNPEIYEDPREVKLGRKYDSKKFYPFSKGERACIASGNRGLAIEEIMAFLITLLEVDAVQFLNPEQEPKESWEQTYHLYEQSKAVLINK